MYVGREIVSYKAGRIDLRYGFEDSDVIGKGHPMHRRARPKVDPRRDPVGIIECAYGDSPCAGK
jgi:hypothetical protein